MMKKLIIPTHTYDPDYGFLTGIQTASVRDFYNESNEPQQNSQSTMHFGLQETFSYDEGTVVESISYDVWGNRCTPSILEYDFNLDNFLFERGYTKHEQLELFAYNLTTNY